MYKRCCITSQGPLLNGDNTKLPDINSCHIFPYAYQQSVSNNSPNGLSRELIPPRLVVGRRLGGVLHGPWPR
jgi:hypothetical protein